MKKVVMILSVVVVLAVGPRAAAKPRSAELPFDLPWPAIVAGAEGRVLVIGTRTGKDGAALVAVDWDPARRAAVREVVIASTDVAGAVVAARAGDRVFVVAEDALPGRGLGLFEIDLSLRLIRRAIVGDGVGPAVAVSEGHVVVGFFEVRPIEGSTRVAFGGVMHVQARARTDLAVVGARKFLSAGVAPLPVAPAHLLDVLEDGVVIAVPGHREARLVRARLPSLAVTGSLTLSVADDEGRVPVYVVGARRLSRPSRGTGQGLTVLALAERWTELSAELEVVARRPVDAPSRVVAVDAESGWVAVDGASPRGRPRTRSLLGVVAATAISWSDRWITAVTPNEEGRPALVTVRR